MRLPAITAKQKLVEHSRELHETIYAHFLFGEPLVIPTDGPEASAKLQYAISGSQKRFWHDRNFRMRTKRVPTGLSVRIEPLKTSGEA